MVRHAPSLRLAALLVVGILGLTGCTEDEPPLIACDQGGPEKYQTCFDDSVGLMYCQVMQVRDYVEDGKVKPRELPDWAILEERNGAPIIYDFRATEIPFDNPGQARGLLRQWAERQQLPLLEGEKLTACAEATTEAEVRESEGGAPWTTTWEFDRRVTG